MKKLTMVLFSAMGIMLSSQCYSGDATGTVGPISIGRPDTGISWLKFRINGTRNGIPSCATTGDEFQISLDNQGGRSMLAALLTAKSLGSQVAVGGFGDCRYREGTESVWWIQLPG